MTSEAPRIVGRYAIYGEIASGGMAAVHLGRLLGPVGFSKTVAIKQLHAQFAKDEEFVSMFIDEARLAARIHHPNVVQTLDVVQHDDQLLLVMEYVHSVQLSTLTRLARKRGEKIPPSIVVAIVSNLLRGLHAAHEASDEHGKPLNIVHRDISPHNVLVGTDGVARVIDFGVAKAAGRLQQTATGQLKGKVPYMAPEQVRGQPVTRQTDVFSSGIVLWETLLAQRLFAADNDAAIISEILGRELEPPSRVDGEIPPSFDAVVMRALERDVSKRFATAREMAEALETADRVAPPSEVSAWLEEIAVEQLAKRSSLIADVESTSAVRMAPGALQQVGNLVEPQSPSDRSSRDVYTNASSSVSTAAQPPKKRLGLMLGLIALLGMAGIGFFIAREVVFRTPAVPATPSGIAASPPTPSPLPSAPATVLTAPSVSTSASVAPATSKPKVKVKVIPTATAPPSTDCDPPYTFDANGMKKYKPHCL